MPKMRKRSKPEDANVIHSSQVYKSKLRQLDCRKNKKPNLSNRGYKSVSSEKNKLPLKIFKSSYSKGKKPSKSSLRDAVQFVETTATNSEEPITQLCEICNQKLRSLNSLKYREFETQQKDQIVQTDFNLSRKENHPQTPKIGIVFGNSTLDCNTQSESKKHILEKDIEEAISASEKSADHCRRNSKDHNTTQDESDILSPEYSPIRDIEKIKKEACLKTSSPKFVLSNTTSDKNEHSVEMVDTVKYIPIEKDIVTTNNPGIPIISRPAERIQTDIYATTSKNSFTERNKSASYLVKKNKLVDEKIYPVLPKVPEEFTFDIKNSLDEKKEECPRYFDFGIPLEDISNNDVNKREYVFSYHEFPIPILKPIENRQLPAEFTLNFEKYYFIRNCPVVKCLSYLHRFAHSSPTNVWTFLCPTSSKIRLPNFIFISTAPTPLPTLYNKKLYIFFENFMNIYSELKVGDNFILLNLIFDNEPPISTPYPLKFYNECENIIPSALFNKLKFKINKARPTVIMETESIENSDFSHSCLFQKFGNFKFVSLNIMPDVISENLRVFPSENQVGVSFPFTVQRDSCSCRFVDQNITLDCPIKAFLLALTNNIRYIQSLAQIDSTVKPFEGIHMCSIQKSKLSPILDTQKASKQLKSKRRKITRNSSKVKRFKKQGNKVNNASVNIAHSTVKRKAFQAIGKNTDKVKRSKTKTMISCDENVLPLNFKKQEPIATILHELNCVEKKGIESIDGNMLILNARDFSQNTPPQVYVMAQQKFVNLFGHKRTSLPSLKSQNSLVSDSAINLSTHQSANKSGEILESKILLRTLEGSDFYKNKSVESTVVDAKRPNLENLKSEVLTSSKSNISNGTLKFPVSTPPNSQKSATPYISSLVKNISSSANNIQTAIKKIKAFTKSEQIGRAFINSVTAELTSPKSLSWEKTILPTKVAEATLQHRYTPLRYVNPDLLGFMEVHFFEPIKGRNPNLTLSVRIPKPINIIANKMPIHPNAILLQSLNNKEEMLKTFLHVRKITSVEEIENFIFNHSLCQNASASKNGFDKQAFMFQPSPSKNMPPFTSSEFENLKRLNDSFLPKGMYLLTPVRMNGICEKELYIKLKNKHLSELKTEIGICYNLGKECVEVEDLLNIPDHLFIDSNVQLNDIF